MVNDEQEIDGLVRDCGGSSALALGVATVLHWAIETMLFLTSGWWQEQ